MKGELIITEKRFFCAFLGGLGFSLFEKIQRGEDHLRDNLRL